jgi:hypothetical protein
MRKPVKFSREGMAECPVCNFGVTRLIVANMEFLLYKCENGGHKFKIKFKHSPNITTMKQSICTTHAE